MGSWRMRIMRFMYGRNGPDKLYHFTVILAFVLAIVGRFFNGIPAIVLSGLSVLLIVYAVFRFFSRNLVKRQAENRRFLAVFAAIRRFFTARRNRFRDRHTHIYKKCPACRAVLRFPRVKGKHSAVCPRCRHRFDVTVRRGAKLKRVKK